MPIFSVSTLRSGFGDARGRAFTAVYRRPSPFARFLAGAVVLVAATLLLALLLILVIPAFVILIALALFAAISHSIRCALHSTREPNGILDGRRNVRVVEREREA